MEVIPENDSAFVAVGQSAVIKIDAIRGQVIEGQQAVQALAVAQTQYLTSVTECNQAQFQFLRAIGIPLDVSPDTKH